MAWPQFSIKIARVHFGNSVHDNSNWDKVLNNLAKKVHTWNRVQLLSERKKITVNQILWSKLCYVGQTYTIPKYIRKKIKKGIYNFLWSSKKIQFPRHLAHLTIWKCGLGMLDIDTQLNSLKINWIQRLLNPTNVLWKDLILYQLNLILNSNQG